MKLSLLIFALLILLASPHALTAQVLGLCGAANENESQTAITATVSATAVQTQHVLRPGDQAVNFELVAVVGDEIKTIKLSEYNGKWRVVCFYPADFTFV